MSDPTAPIPADGKAPAPTEPDDGGAAAPAGPAPSLDGIPAPVAAAIGALAADKPKGPAKRRGLVRWGFLIVLLGGTAGAAFALKDKVALAAARSVGAKALGGPLEVESAHVRLQGGVITLKKLVAKDPANADDERFSAAEAVIDLDLVAALRGRIVIEELRLSSPRGKVVRRKDGSIGITEEPPGPGEPGGPGGPGGPAEPGGPVAGGPGTGEPGQPGEPVPTTEQWRKRLEKLEELAKKRDFVEDLKQVAEEVQRRVDERRRQQEAAKAGGRDPSGRAAWVREGAPLIVVKRLICDDVELDIRDEAAAAPPIRLVQARLEVQNLSSDPLAYADPIALDLQGQLAEAEGSLVRLAGVLDMKVERLRSTLALTGDKLPAHLFDPLLARTLPVRLEPGTLCSLALPLAFDDFAIDWRPVIELAAIAVSARDPSQRTIAGLDAAKVIQALREVREVRFEDLRVLGTVFEPRVETGDTLRQLVTEGGKAFAARKASEKAAELGARADQAIGAQADKLIEKAGGNDLLQGATGLGGAAAQGAAKEATEGAARGLRGLFGGSQTDEDK